MVDSARLTPGDHEIVDYDVFELLQAEAHTLVEIRLVLVGQAHDLRRAEPASEVLQSLLTDRVHIATDEVRWIGKFIAVLKQPIASAVDNDPLFSCDNNFAINGR